MITDRKKDSSKWRIHFLLKVFQVDHSNKDNLSIALDHLSSLFNEIGAYVELNSVLRNKHGYWLEKNRLKSKDFFSCSDKLIHDDEPCLDLFEGFIDIEESTQSFAEIINHLTGPLESVSQFIPNNGEKVTVNLVAHKIGFIWKFVEENDHRFEDLSDFGSVSLMPSQFLKFRGFSFGNFINGTIFVQQFNSVDQPINSPEFNLRHTDELMELIFEVKSQKFDQRFKLVFEYKTVRAVTISRSESGYNVFFHISNPPKIYIETHDMDPDIIDMKKSKFHVFDYQKHRFNPFPRQRFFGESWTRWHDCGCISPECIGRSSVFSLNLPHDSSQDLLAIVRCFYVWRRYSRLSIFFGSIEIIKGSHRPIDLISDIPFDVNYALQCIQSVSYAFQDDLIINDQFHVLLNFIKLQITENNTGWLITAMYKLCDDYLYRKVYHGLSRLLTIFKRVEKDWPSIDKMRCSSNPYIKHLRRVLLTPTRILILPEYTFQSCQFLEIAQPECVLRLTIRDEDMGNLGFAVTRNEEDCAKHDERAESPDIEAKLPSPYEYFLKKCFAERLLPSFNISGKSYHIYGASTSQLRDHGMVLYAPDANDRDAESMRDTIGRIEVTEISKYIARIGLSLSQVLAFVDLPADIEVRYTKDVTGGLHPDSKKPYNFTDGCGLMSTQLAEYIWKDLKRQGVIKIDRHKEEKKISTAYQIRFMGCKGMIILDENLSGKVIVLRESMRKVDSLPGKLGIVKISEPRRAYLNKPLVTILNQIGLDNHFFVNLLSEAIDDLVESFRCNDKASKTLFMFSDLHRFVDYQQLVEHDYDLLGDPFFRASLELVFHQGLDVIKQKARIPLDLDIARTLFGVADPTATYHLPYALIPNRNSGSKTITIFHKHGQSSFPCSKNSLFFDEEPKKALNDSTTKSESFRKGVLKYGEVFIFPSDFDEPLKGNVIVTKFPCMHPGDVRRLEAVDKEELHGIRDCIVFPVDGARPHSNEMAGSDLDGDEYCVIWAQEFMDINIHPPMEFPDVSHDKNDPINNHEIVMFYTRYLQDCAVGRIASAHLVWADMLPQGIFHDRNIELARKYSISLDFAKTGDTKTLSKEERYRESPDFSQNWNIKPSYHSARALGSVYRTISMFELFLAEETSKLKIIEPVIDPKLEHPDWKKYLHTANRDHETYVSIVSHILDISEFGDEVELFTQINEKSVLFGPNSSKMHRSQNHTDSTIFCVYNLLVKPITENFYEEFNSLKWHYKSKEELADAKMAKASAYYMISMKKVLSSKKSFCGLPWIGKYSIHLFELLAQPGKPKKIENRLTVTRNMPTVSGGFSGDIKERKAAADSCWKFLSKWLAQYLMRSKAEANDSNRIIKDMKDLFVKIIDYYISGKRKTESPGWVLLQIFSEIISKQKCLDFKQNLFDACNDPIGLMTVLILERKYYEGTCISKIPDGSFNCNTNSTYFVLSGKDDDSVEIGPFISLLKTISGCVSIVHTPALRNHDSYKLSVFGSRASILICQTIIGLQNRLKSSNPHYKRKNEKI